VLKLLGIRHEVMIIKCVIIIDAQQTTPKIIGKAGLRSYMNFFLWQDVKTAREFSYFLMRGEP
jgi:hypothetical protein